MSQPRDRNLDHLDHNFRPYAYALLAKSIEAGIMVMIIETRRTEEQHQEDLMSGHSWNVHSKHQDGLAIDICPFEEYALNGANKLMWNANNPVWTKIGIIGESLGLGWGGRWQQKDMGHFEKV